MTLHSINAEQGLYVLSEGKGYSCLGFDYAFQRATKVHAWLGGRSQAPRRELVGTAEGYAEYERVMNLAAGKAYIEASRCPVELLPQLNGLVGKLVEVVDHDGETRRFRVGRSTGWLPIYLEMRPRAKYGDPADSRGYKSVRVVR
jgi:hypothetical protein